MIKIDFEYDEKHAELDLHIPEDKYKAISLIGGKGWYSEGLEEDIANVLRCKAGTFVDENGDDSFYIGYENSPGIILVFNDDRAYVFDGFGDRKEPFLILELGELLDILYQMRDFLKSIGK